MSRTLNNFAPVALLLAVVALQACSTTPEAVPVTEPAPVEAVVENTPAPEIAPEPAPAQVAVAEQPQVSTQMEPKK